MMILSSDIVMHSLIRNGECEAYQNHVAARNLSGRAFNIDITNGSRVLQLCRRVLGANDLLYFVMVMGPLKWAEKDIWSN